jgi:S-adenosylmethionine hydrolase
VAPPLITLLTDFGHTEPYVGVMKGVLHQLCPEASLVDLTHDIAPAQIETASFWLRRSVAYFPAGSIHVAVVDPGVGTDRRAVAAQIGGHYFVCPDNGILTDVLLKASASDESRSRVGVVALSRRDFSPPHVGPRGLTFDGRDLFAPAAGRLAKEGSLKRLGVPLAPSSLVGLDLHVDPMRARVRAIDRYGNVITDTPVPDEGQTVVTHQGAPLRWVSTYGEALPGELVALAGSFGTIEVALNRGNAAKQLGVRVGSSLTLASQ